MLLKMEKQARSRNHDRITFFQQFLKHPLQIGSVIPSSHFLEQRILEAAGVATANTIVELGSGTGGTTRAILRAMPQHARLLSIEINPQFHSIVKEIEDERLIAHLGSACDVKEIMEQYGLAFPEAIISGIPFSTMGDHNGSKVVEAVASLLVPNGRFVAYQVSSRIVSLCRPYLGDVNVSLELLNIPPMWVYQWLKKEG